MSVPPAHDPWDQELDPVDPETLPPGFYFPPGEEPKAAASGLSATVKWLLIAIVVVVVIIALVIALVV